MQKSVLSSKFNKSMIIDCGLYKYSSLDLDLDLNSFHQFLQVKGFFDILPDEITDAFEDKTFSDKFLKYLCYEEQDLKRELIKEMQDKDFIDDISDQLKKRFTDMTIIFSKIFHER